MVRPVDIEPFLELVQKPARYIGGEVGACFKPPAEVSLRVALCFPDIYEVAESHLGLKILYDLLNREPGVFAERVYALWPDMSAALAEHDLPLFSLETRRPLADFDLIAFSVNHELSYATLLHMLDQGRLPLRAEDRLDRQPLVIAGGPAMVNPEPLAEILDAAVLGDGEEVALELARALRALRGQPRAERLSALAAIEGIYVPALRGRSPEQAPVSMRRVQDLDAIPSPERLVVPHIRPVHDRVAIELQRGCTRGCRFCQAGYIYRPLRQRHPTSVAAGLERALAATGYDEAGLLSLSAGDYGALEPLFDLTGPCLEARQASLSVPSLRLETLSPALAREVMRRRGGGFTLAPEAATERLRAVIGKAYREEELLRATQAAFEAGAKHLKLYFMIGLPTETDEDVEAIAALAQRVLVEARRSSKRARATVSISTFVPKPHTPFQWEAQILPDEVRRKQGMVRDGLHGGRLQLRWHDAQMSAVEGIYARGDRRLGAVLLEAYRHGARLDAWTEHFRADRHLDALAKRGLDLAELLGPRTLDAPLAWNAIDSGVLRKFLQRERGLAHAGRTREDCTRARCLACGVCDFDRTAAVAFYPGLDGSVQRVERPLQHRDNRVQLQQLRLQGSAGTEPEETAAEEGAETGRVGVAAGRDRPADTRVAVLRLRLAKRAPAVYLSHLETLASLGRALRRARLPVAYSGGFHATPRISSPHALATGMVSHEELFDVALRAPAEASDAAAALSRELPRGLELLDVLRLPPEAPGIGELIGGARYEARLTLPAEVAQEALERFLGAEHWPLERVRKGKRRMVDLKVLLVDLSLDGARFSFTLRLPPEGTVRPTEAVAALFGADACAPRGLEKIGTLFVHELAPPPALAADRG